MALTATATLGMQFIRNVQADEVLWVPGDPGDAITRESVLHSGTAGEGIVDLGAADEEHTMVSLKTVTMAAAATGFPYPGRFDPGSDSSNTLIPARPLVAAGTPVYKCTFANHADDTVAAYTAATPSLTLTNALGGDDYSNGALIYVYSGTGAGQVNIGADYVDATKVLTLHRAFATALDTTSKVIVLDGATANGGVGFFSTLEMADDDNLDVSDGADDASGDWTVYLSWEQAASYLKNLTLPVIKTSAMYK